MFLPKLIRNQLLAKTPPCPLPEIETQLYNPITVGKASRVNIGYGNKRVSALYCRLGDFARVDYSETLSCRPSYPILAVNGRNFCCVTASIATDFSTAVRDRQTDLPETFTSMNGFPVLGIIGDSFGLTIEIHQRFPYLRFTARPVTEELKFYMNGELVASLPAGISLDYITISKPENFVKEIRAEIRKAVKQYKQKEQVQIERISA